MTAAPYAVRPGDLEHGHICPDCAGPKHRQSRRCQRCYGDWRHANRLGGPVMRGPANPRWSGGPKPPTGAPTGRPQPLSHPWRKTNGLLKPHA